MRMKTSIWIRTLAMFLCLSLLTESVPMTAMASEPESVQMQAAGEEDVAEEQDNIIGCGAIGPYWGREDESSLFTIFVLPEYQGKGIGRAIIDTLEKDEFFLRAKRIEIPASITGVPFYLKMGYNYKNGITEPDEEHLIRLEKRRDVR